VQAELLEREQTLSAEVANLGKKMKVRASVLAAGPLWHARLEERQADASL